MKGVDKILQSSGSTSMDVSYTKTEREVLSKLALTTSRSLAHRLRGMQNMLKYLEKIKPEICDVFQGKCLQEGEISGPL